MKLTAEGMGWGGGVGVDSVLCLEFGENVNYVHVNVASMSFYNYDFEDGNKIRCWGKGPSLTMQL